MLQVSYIREINKLAVAAPFDQSNICRGIPLRRWDKKLERWVAPLTTNNIKYLRDVGAHFSEEAMAWCEKVTAHRTPELGKLPSMFGFKTTPLKKQLEALLRSTGKEAFAYFMDPGTGKTKILIDDFTTDYLRNHINAVFIICPNSVKSNWADELQIHSSINYLCHVYKSEKKKLAEDFVAKVTPELKIMVMGIESLSQGNAHQLAKDFVLYHNTYMAVDESSRIKNHDATRTRRVIDMGKHAKRRRVATGTPMTKGVQHVWPQYQFLDEYILDHNYFAFRNHFCVMGGYKGKQIIASQNIDELTELVAPFTFFVKKHEMGDLPPKVKPKPRRVQPTPEMKRLYTELEGHGATRIDDRILSYQYVITRDLRLQQICGGFVYTERLPDPNAPVESALAMIEKGRLDPIKGGNPKVDEIVSIAEDTDGKIIVWCRFRAEIDAVAEALRKLDDGEVVEFHGGVGEDDRASARQRFQNDPKVRFFVGQISTGGIGITLTAASTVVYMSNSYNLEDRIQSEDRAHRIGQDKSVLYLDIVMEDEWVDGDLVTSLRNDENYIEHLMKKFRQEQDNGQSHLQTGAKQ